MPQTNHGSVEWLRFPNPQYPGDRTKMIKKWIRDSWSRRKIVALQQKFAVVAGTFGNANTWGAYVPFPTGFTNSNCVMLSFETKQINLTDWRMGEGSNNTSYGRVFCAMDANGVRGTTSLSHMAGASFRITLMRTDI